MLEHRMIGDLQDDKRFTGSSSCKTQANHLIECDDPRDDPQEYPRGTPGLPQEDPQGLNRNPASAR